MEKKLVKLENLAEEIQTLLLEIQEKYFESFAQELQEVNQDMINDSNIPEIDNSFKNQIDKEITNSNTHKIVEEVINDN